LRLPGYAVADPAFRRHYDIVGGRMVEESPAAEERHGSRVGLIDQRQAGPG
jgi:hypothetical protein